MSSLMRLPRRSPFRPSQMAMMAALTGAALACAREFAGGDDLEVHSFTLRGSGALSVTDTVTVAADIRDAAGHALSGVHLEWSSSDDDVVELLSASSDESVVESARIVARKSGTVVLQATIAEPGFRSRSAELTVSVRPWAVGPASAWPDTMTVTMTDTVELVIPNVDSLSGSDLRVVWLSSDERIASVVRELAPDTANRAQLLAAKRRAIVTARRSGPVQVVATIVREGFEASEVRRSIAIRPLRFVPLNSWPDSLVVAESATVDLRVVDHRGNAMARQIQWAFAGGRAELVNASGERARFVARVRGSTEITAKIALEGFEPIEMSRSLYVLERWTMVSAGGSGGCAVASDGRVYCWGGTARFPTLVSPPADMADVRYSMVSAGAGHTCALSTMGRAYCWGTGFMGQLGDDGDERELVPVPVVGGHTFVQLKAGGESSCGITLDQRAFCWGSNESGQLGLDFSTPGQEPLDSCIMPYDLHDPKPCSLTPRQVTGRSPSPGVFSSIEVGSRHACAVGTSPPTNAYCWGRGPLGSTISFDHSRPWPVSGGLQFSSLSAGTWHTCGIEKGGQAYCWGEGSSGELGGTLLASIAPWPVAGPHRFVAVSAGFVHTCGIVTSGRAYCWGDGSDGRLGNGTLGKKDRPDSVRTSETFTSISASSGHTCGVTPRGAIYCWGQAYSYELGNGSLSPSSVPVRIREPEQ